MENRIRNRRWSKRTTYIAGISVYDGTGAVREYRARNISLEGLLVKPTIEGVEKGSLLEILLPVQRPGNKKRNRTPVVVVHTSGDGPDVYAL